MYKGSLANYLELLPNGDDFLHVLFVFGEIVHEPSGLERLLFVRNVDWVLGNLPKILEEKALIFQTEVDPVPDCLVVQHDFGFPDVQN